MTQTRKTPPARPGVGGVFENNLEMPMHDTATPGEGEAGESAGPEGDRERQDSAPRLAVSFTVFQSPAPLSKRYTLDDGGNVAKTPAANMTEGRAVRVSLAFAEFGTALAQATERVAFGYGLHDPTHGEAVKLAIAAKADPAKGILARTREYFDYRPGPGVLMVDHDPHPDGPAVTAEELRDILAAVCPAFADAAAWVRGSLSAGVHPEGEVPKPGRGFHVYLPVADAADIPRFGKTLVKCLWLAGHGFIAVSSAGSFLVRALIDGAVFDGERLDFVGKPMVGPGLAYTPPEATYHAGGYLDTHALPDLTEEEERQLAALIAQAKQAREADRRARRAKWEESHVRAMVGRGVPEPEARAQTRQIPADGKPGDLYRDWPLEFDKLGFATVADVLADPGRYDGAALADPLEGVGYGRSTAKFFANVGGKPCIHSHAHGGARYFLKASAGPEPRPPEPPFDPAYHEAQFAGMREEGDAGAWAGLPPSAESPPMPRDGAAPISEGGRKRHLASLAGDMRRRGKPVTAILAALCEENRVNCSPPLADKELKAIASSAGRYAPTGDGWQAAPFQPLEWPDPIIPGQTVTPEIPADLLPGWVGDMAAAVALHTKTPTAMAVLTELSVLATVLQRRFEVAPYGAGFGYTEPLALWTLTALPPGANKTAVLSALAHPLNRWEKLARDRMRRDVARNASERDVAMKRIEALKIQAGKAKAADDRERLRAEIQQEMEDMPAELISPQLITTSITAEHLEQLLVDQHERMAILSDEGGIFQTMSGQYSGGVANIDVYLKGHSGSSMRTDRAKRKAHIDKPALSFGLAIQPGILAESAKTKRFRDSGLLGRFLYAIPKSNVGTRDVRERHAIPEAVKAAWEANIHALLDKMDLPIGAPVVLAFDDDAREHWLDFAQKVENGQGDGGQFEHISDWTSKLPGAVARIAGLLHLAVHGVDARTVDLDSVRRAVQLGRLLTPHAVAAFALMGASKAEADALHVYRWIKARGVGEFTRREVQAALRGRIGTVEPLIAALKQLAEQFVISPELRTETGELGGRPSAYYQVNPKLL